MQVDNTRKTPSQEQAKPKQLLEELPSSSMAGLPEGQDARIIAQKARDLESSDGVLVHICLDDSRLYTLKSLIQFFAPDVSVLTFPAWDCLPYDRVSPHKEIVAERVSALSSLLEWKKEQKRYPRILLTTVNAVLQKVMPQSALQAGSLIAKAGESFDVDHCMQYLSSNGYVRTQTVRESGEFAVRGGIVDIFPPGYSNPIRLDMFGDSIESIKSFHVDTQRSINTLSDISLKPASEFFLDSDSIAQFRSSYREAFGVVRENDPLYEAVSAGRRYNGMEHWLPFFYQELETVFDYIASYELTSDFHALAAAQERTAHIEDFYQARKTLEDRGKQKTQTSSSQKKQSSTQDVSLSGTLYRPIQPHLLYLKEECIQKATEFIPFLGTQEDKENSDKELSQGQAKKGRDFSDIRALPDGDVFSALKQHISYLRSQNAKNAQNSSQSQNHELRVFIAAYSQGSKERLKGLLHSAHIEVMDCTSFQEIKKLHHTQIGIVVLGLERGFAAQDFAIITEQDILGDRLARKTARRKKADNFLTEVSSLQEGDLVVHIDHGVGKFLELETVKAHDILHDCLKIEYLGGDKLFVPVENIEILSRFGGDEGSVQLDKLGGANWQARKAKVKKDLMAMADHLLGIAAKRKLKKTQALQISQDLYNEFSSQFPYTETEDQQRSIEKVLQDIAQDTPMDRLVCGDVGFGKTEVALRAAYVAAMSGTQVALVVPTTLLARQHYKNFVQRFENTGLRVEQLSRLVSSKKAQDVKKGLATGEVNIVIGTHALFSKDISFSSLGLVVLDEEQRFGVKQKEKLKEFKSNVHVLTLSATPIPRTLQMALTGVKEMSLIATPPIDRLAVRTFILPYDSVVIREALLREHYRGGQSFYVCPRIKDMDALQDELKELVPEVKVISAHGQMKPEEIEDRMSAFYEGQYDVLLATNIIESGIDIPSANTMIIHRADMFGLAQLYQIRGRIGRSKLRAYAYLTYPAHQKLNKQALKRLEVMETLDTLGAGFQLASHDMDIRGAGNLLGDQQSGHIKEVGVELYQQMLEEAVAAVKEGVDLDNVQNAEPSTVNINLGMSVLIPEGYVQDLGTRMSLYRRLSEIDHKDDIESFAAELIDRFGPIPQEVENLLDIVSIKRFCKMSSINEIEAGPKGAVIGFHNNTPANVEALMLWIADKGAAVKLRPDQKLVAIRHWDSLEKRVQGIKNLVKELSELS